MKIKTWWLDSNVIASVFFPLHVRLTFPTPFSTFSQNGSLTYARFYGRKNYEQIQLKKKSVRNRFLETLKQFIELLYTRLTISTPPPTPT